MLKSTRPFASIAYFLGSFIVCLTVACVFRDGSPHPDAFADIDHYLELVPSFDARSYAHAAKDLFMYGRLTDATAWVFFFWPPGFVTLVGLILKVLGPSAPVVLSLQVVASLALAGMFAFERRALVPAVGATGAAVLPFIVLLVPGFRNFLLEPEGVIMGETFAISMFFSSVFLLIVSLDEESFLYAVAAGAFLAVSAYFRAQFELITLILTLAAIVFGAGVFALFRFRPLRHGRSDFARMAKTLLVYVVVANALMIPWRLHNLGAIHSMRWVITSDVVAFNHFASTDYLTSNGGGFVVDGGGNLGCALEPSLCGKGKSSDLLPVFVRHFFAWEAIKASILPKYWFASLDYVGAAALAPARADLVWNWLLALTVPLTFVGLLAARAYRWRPVLIWLTGSFSAYLFVVLSIVHFEVRYFFLPKMFFFHMTVLLAAIAWRTRTSGRPALAREAVAARS